MCNFPPGIIKLSIKLENKLNTKKITLYKKSLY